MTGRDLIIYILSNGLEDAPVLQNGKLVGFMSVGDAAVKMNVGTATICALFRRGDLQGTRIGGELLITPNSVQAYLNKQ